MSLAFALKELNYYHSLINSENNHQIELLVDIKLEELYNNKLPFNRFDDIYTINVYHGKGKIIGVNPRSVLLGIYAYFRKLNCKFLKPGRNNEILPNVLIEACNVTCSKTFTNRHRAVCIEGANSIQNVLDMIDFLPKSGMNSYFVQFFTPYEFFERWYKHQKNEYLESEKYTIDDAKQMHALMIKEIKKRDLIYQAVGHGWTMAALGYRALGWHKADEYNPQIEKQYLAEINDKRDFFKGIPLNTQLCYSNDIVKAKLVDTIVNYAEENPEVDILHFWLADDFNNHCECDLCKDKYPSENYVKILNLLDQKLKSKNLDTKIAFLVYFELFWVNKDIRIENPDRFIMMFAPITRTFTKSYKDSLQTDNISKSEVIPEFNLNKNIYPETIDENLKYLRSWQEVFGGDSFLFDYHLMWDGFKDYPMLKLSRVIYDDMKSLNQLNLNGFISCQLQRVFYPTGHAFYTMVQALSEDTTYDQILNEYFDSIYRNDSKEVIAILRNLSSYFYHDYARGERPVIDAEVANSSKEVRNVIPDLLNQVNSIYLNVANSDKLKKRETEILIHFIKFLEILSKGIEEKAKGNECVVENGGFDSLKKHMLINEVKFQDIYDGYFFHHIIKEFLEKKW